MGSRVNRCVSLAGASLSFTAKLTKSTRSASVFSHLNSLAVHQQGYGLQSRFSTCFLWLIKSKKQNESCNLKQQSIKMGRPLKYAIQAIQWMAAFWCKCFCCFVFHPIIRLSNMPPNTTRHTMHWGTALPLTRCSNKAEGHSSCQSCSQRLAWRTNGGLFSVRPPPCCPARPRSTRGGQRRCVCCCLVHWYGKACAVVFINFSTGPKKPQMGETPPWLWKQRSSYATCGFVTNMSTSRFLDSNLQFKKYSDTHTGMQLFVKWLPASPRPAQGSANPPCVSQIPSVFVRQQRGHLLMTFHVFTGVLPRSGGQSRGGRQIKSKDRYLCWAFSQLGLGNTGWIFEDREQISELVSHHWITVRSSVSTQRTKHDELMA